jgi:hypothetical protein
VDWRTTWEVTCRILTDSWEIESTAVPSPVTCHRYGSTRATQFQQLVAYCVMRYLATFFGKAIHSAVQKHLVNFLVNCVRRSRLCCSDIHGRMGQTWWIIARKSMDPVAIKQGSMG